MFELYFAKSFSDAISSLTMGWFLLTIVYVVVGAWFASKHIAGQILFLGIGVLLVLFGGTLTTLTNWRLSLVPMNLGPLPVSLFLGSTDITYALPIAFVLLLVWGWHNGDLKEVQKMVT